MFRTFLDLAILAGDRLPGAAQWRGAVAVGLSLVALDPLGGALTHAEPAFPTAAIAAEHAENPAQKPGGELHEAYAARYGAEVADLLVAHANALGGAAAVLSMMPRVLHGELTEGGRHVGSMRSYLLVDGRFRQTMIVGNVRTTVGFDGRNAWFVDSTGQGHSLRGAEADRIIFSGALDTRCYLDPRWSLTEFRPAPPETLDGLPHDVLLLRGRSGLEMRLLFDRAEHLIRRTSLQIDGQPVILDYEDYRTVHNVALPFRLDQRQADGSAPLRLRLQAVDPIEGFRPELVQMPATLPLPAYRLSEGDRALGIPLDVRAGRVLLQVRINAGTPQMFLLDTGTAGSCLDLQVAQRLGLQLSADTVPLPGLDQAAVVAAASPDSLRIGDRLVIREPRLAVADLSGLRPGDSPAVAGILGGDLFRQLVVALDLEAGRMDLYDPATYHYGGPGAEVALSFDHQLPRVVALVNGAIPGRFQLDLGVAAPVLLNRSYVRLHHLRSASAPARQPAAVGDAPLHLDSLLINGRQLTDLQATVQTVPAAAASDDPEFAGALGLPVWRRFRLVLDYSARRGWIDGPRTP